MSSNDKEVSKLISKSLRHQLTPKESSTLNDSIAQSEQSRGFLELSTLIQKSVSDAVLRLENGDDAVAPPMPNETRQRLRDSIRKVIADSSSGQPSHSAMTRPTVVPAESTQRVMGDMNRNDESRQMLSRFSIIRKLGNGGLGTVWLARDEKLNRNVAIKEINQAAAEIPSAWERFHREAEITGHLEHPNVISLYQFGMDPKTAQPFYAMRFVGKRTLADAILEYHERRTVESLRSGCLQLHRLLGDFLRICQAIAYAHSRGVIHRDLKPENVAIDNYGQVIVLDWGLAKILDTAELSTQMLSSNSLSDSLTQTIQGEVIGTPLYMAPEQAAGDLDNIDERTDIYGLGAILFAILTGRAPHERSSISNDGNLSMDEVLARIAKNETPSPREYLDGVPHELEQICLKAMARRRFARFESAVALSDAVERWMAGQSEKTTRYETLRMQGRELRAELQGVVDDLESNVRFMSRLPPIQELMNVESEEDDVVWRERLAQIFMGLLGAKSQFKRVGYSSIQDGKFTELVRVERHSRERANVRKVPRSKLQTGELNEYINRVIDNQPDEVLSSLVCNPMCCNSDPTETSLVAGVPVYHDQTEELFGMIMIECSLQDVFTRQMGSRLTAVETIVASDTHQIMTHRLDGELQESSKGKQLSDVAPRFEKAIEKLQSESEFLDNADHEIYGARLWLVPRCHGVMYLLRLK